MITLGIRKSVNAVATSFVNYSSSTIVVELEFICLNILDKSNKIYDIMSNPQAKKMTTVKEQISSLKQSDWDYYADIGNKELKNPFTSRLSHKNFVKKYFKRSGKNDVLDFIKYMPNQELNNNRIKHTNSIFFLGVLIYNRTNLQSDFFDNLNTAEYRRFPFLWFLTCLFHDFGFDIEKDSKAINGIKNLSDLKNKYSINNCLLKTKPKETNKVLISSIENYFKYRLNNSKIDHGIFAGLYFYDSLLKIRKRKILNNETTLFWGKELEEQYAQVATAICVHNIGIPEKKDFKEYKKYNLDKLITDFKPLKFKDFPLLYILGIVDTIDPIKTYIRFGFRPKEILESLEMGFNENKVIFRNGKNSKLNFKKMIENADRLKNWLNVKIEHTDSELYLILR